MSYKIRAKCLNGDVLTFSNVPSYKVIEGFVVFNNKHNELRYFAVSNCEIEEEK